MGICKSPVIFVIDHSMLIKKLAHPNQAAVNHAMRELRKVRGVQGCYLGRKFTGGVQTKEIAIVCLVKCKKPGSKLKGSQSTVPPHVVCADMVGRGSTRLNTDVQKSDARITLASSISFNGPGDSVIYGGRIATVGMALEHPVYGKVVTTAGHLVLGDRTGEVTYQKGRRPSISLRANDGSGVVIRGELIKAVVSELADYALIKPSANQTGNYYHDALGLGSVYLPAYTDINKRPMLLTSGSTPVNTVTHGVHANLVIGGTYMRNLILTKYVSQPGDSGSCLVDSSLNIWGTLVGGVEVEGRIYSAFAPAAVPIYFENSELC